MEIQQMEDDMKKRKQFIYLVFSLFVCAGLMFLAVPVLDEIIHVDSPQMDPSDNLPWSSMGYYRIDPSAILMDIKNGQKDVFRWLEDKTAVPEHPSGSFPWTSDEYFAVARAHHLYLTGEPVKNNWKIYSPGDFQINQCRDEMQGFDSATIIFYKKEPGSFLVTYMEIKPLNESVSSVNTEYQRQEHRSAFDRFFDDPDSHFEEAKVIQGEINAEDALRIAENAGGKEMRQKLSNDDCKIRIGFFVDKWVVWYYWKAKDLNFTLDFEINSENGSYKIEQDLKKCERTICP